MLLKNPMEGKKLNLNRPLLSARRYSPKVSSQKDDKSKIDNSVYVIPRLPPYKSELKSGPIRNPGAVPFQWEQTPGQPKEDIKPITQICSRPPIAPKLPPGRYPKAKEHDSHQVSHSENKIQAVNIHPESRSGSFLDENIIQSNEENTEENKSSCSGHHDEAYVSALDTLSRTESFFLDCSMSRLSGLDDLDLEPSGGFSTDPQTREFMMDRFLPAAKAMASETPQYASRKQSAVREQPKQVEKKTVYQYKPSLRYGPSFTKRYSHYHDNEEGEEESDDDCDQHGNLPIVCGLLPRFCLKSSLCLLNPVPAMSVRTRVPPSPNKTQPRSSSTGSHTETEIEQSKSDISELKPVDKVPMAELEENKTNLRNESGQLESPNTLTYFDAPLSFVEEKDVFGIPEETKHFGIKGFGSHVKGFKTFQELLADQDSPEESDSGGSVVEKTVYVDTVQKVESPNMRSPSPNAQDTTRVHGSREEDHTNNTKRTDHINVIDSSLEEFKNLDTLDTEAKLLPIAHKSGGLNIVSSNDKANRKWGMEMPEAFGENQDFDQDSTTTRKVEVAEKRANDTLEKQPRQIITLENSHKKHSQFPVPPPLPKSPSDSWLWRTLPSMSTKNVSLRSYPAAATNPQNHGSKAPTGDTKWEAIVKSTKMKHHNLCYSEELSMPIPEN